MIMGQLALKVQMLGDFSVSYNENTLISENSRNNNVIHLFQYLLVRHSQAIRQDELIFNLLGDSDEYDDPVHTLKNIVYRLRKFLAASGLPGREYIYFQKGAYGLCSDIEYELDIERFESAAKNAGSDALNEDGRLEFCMEAISVYSGDFLPRSSNMQWVLPRAVRYQELFLNCVKTAYNILRKRQNLTPMIDVFEKALSLYPYEEQLHLLYISCLYSLNKVKEAVSHYEFAAAVLFDELGISPSAEMQALYNQIAETLHLTESSIEDIRTDMNEDSVERGAYYCNYQVFTNTYRVIVRHAERSGQSAFLMLMSLDNTGFAANTVGKMKNVSDALHNAIKTSLRRGDLYTRFSPTQFIVMLMDINLENCRIVSNRITENFKKQIKDKTVRLSSQALSAIDIDCVMNG